MRRLFAIFVLALLGATAAAAWVVWALHRPYQNFSASGVFVDVPHGAARRTVARLLADQGVISNRWLFEGLTRWRSGRTLQAGEYFFDRPASALEVFDKIADGKIFVRQLVVPEGYSMFEIAGLVERAGLTTREDFLAAARSPQLVRELCAGEPPASKGFFSRPPIEFPRHMSGQDIAAAMVRRFQQEWETVSAQALNSARLSLQNAVTLASLVESETPQPAERPLVAGVFLNRLNHRIPLQCDPTVAYAMELAGKFGGKLEAGDLRFDSRYNTYRHIGLPPGPIANPGTHVVARRARSHSDGHDLFRGQRRGRPRFQPDTGRTQPERGKLSPTLGTAAPCGADRCRNGHGHQPGKVAMSGVSEETRKKRILEIAEDLGVEQFTPAEVEQIRRQLIARFGAGAKANAEYIHEVLEDAGLRVNWSTQADSEDLYEEEFRDLLHFATLEEAEMCLMRLDELVRKFRSRRRARRRETRAGSGQTRPPPRRDDRPQSARGPQEARGEAGNPGVVPHLAANPGSIFRVARRAQALPRLPAAFRRQSLRGRAIAPSGQRLSIAWRWRPWSSGPAPAPSASN